MNRYFWLLLIVFALGAMIMTFTATISSASLVMEPGEIISQGLAKDIPRLRVAGAVAAMPVDYQTSPNIRLTFTLQDSNDPESMLPVIYYGLRPDMFAPGRDVIIDGEFRNGTIYASSLLTQCPSKYEPPTGGYGEGYESPEYGTDYSYPSDSHVEDGI